MNIVNVKNETPKEKEYAFTFKDLNCGEIFRPRLSDAMYMRTVSVCDEQENLINAINLFSGEFMQFLDDEQVSIYTGDVGLNFDLFKSMGNRKKPF